MNRPNPVAIVHEHWGQDAPDWVIALADAVERTSQTKAGTMIGYSAPVVSAVLRNTYRGSLSKLEQAVRGAFLKGTVSCPELGIIPGQDCIAHQRRAAHFQNTNPLRIRMFRACRQCPRNQQGGAS